MNMSTKVRILNFFRRVWMIPFLESFLASQTRGLPPDHVLCKLVPNPYQYSPGTSRLFERDGIKMRVDISDYVGHYLYFGFEDRAMKKLFSLCPDNATVIDVGANIGWTALHMAHQAAHGKVYGFEPDPYNAEQCIENVKRNGLQNIEIFSFGLGNAEGTVNMEERTPSNRGGNRIAPLGASASRPVQITRMDSVSHLRSEGKIGLIKIDVEGYELQVLKGARAILREHKPILFIELDDNNLRDQGDSANELIRFLGEMGYESLSNAENNLPVTVGMDFTKCHIDVVAQ